VVAARWVLLGLTVVVGPLLWIAGVPGAEAASYAALADLAVRQAVARSG
jgi:hypothetical protein